MEWLSCFRKRDQNLCTAWGYTFQVTPQHLSKDETAALKMSYDVLGEAALDRLNILCPPQATEQRVTTAAKASAADASQPPPDPPSRKRDLYLLLQDHAQDDEILGRLWADVNTVPPWVCWEQIGRGQEVFYRYGGPALTGLAFQSLLGGMVD